jgi:hypothetical protein
VYVNVTLSFIGDSSTLSSSQNVYVNVTSDFILEIAKFSKCLYVNVTSDFIGQYQVVKMFM